MIEPFLKGSGFLQLPLGKKENENVLFIYLKKEEYTVYVYFLEEEIFHQKLCGLVISQTFTSWNTAVPFSLNTFDLPQTLQFKSLVT